jgi:aspartyl protease family protein
MIIILVALLGSVGLVMSLDALFPGVLAHRDAQMQLAYGLGLVAVVFSSLALTPRLKAREIVKAALTWVAVFLALLVFYRYQDGFRQLGREMIYVVDPAQPKSEAREVHIRASMGGHFVVLGEVEGESVRFLVDTGASEVVLSQADARHVGIKTDRLAYVMPVQTANGQTYVAPVRLKKLRVGTIELEGVRAAVARDGLDTSLLGLTFLNRLSAVNFSRQELVLKE